MINSSGQGTLGYSRGPKKGEEGSVRRAAEGQIKECTPPVYLEDYKMDTVIVLVVSFLVCMRLRANKQTKQCNTHPTPSNMKKRERERERERERSR